MEEWLQLGEHGYPIERDLIRWRNEGMLLPEEVAGMMRLFQEMTGAMRHIHLSFFPSVAAAATWLLAERQH